MTWEPRPLPEVTPETKRFWAATLEDRLLLNRCRACGLVYYYPRAHCPDCLSDDVAWIDANGDGEIYSYTVVHQAASWPNEYLPFVLAYVTLEEGVTIMTNIVDVDPSQVAVGDPVSVSFVPTEKGSLAVPVYTPRESTK